MTGDAVRSHSRCGSASGPRSVDVVQRPQRLALRPGVAIKCDQGLWEICKHSDRSGDTAHFECMDGFRPDRCLAALTVPEAASYEVRYQARWQMAALPALSFANLDSCRPRPQSWTTGLEPSVRGLGTSPTAAVTCRPTAHLAWAGFLQASKTGALLNWG